MLKIVLIFSLFFGAQAFGDDHDHQGFPEGTLIAFDGQDAVSKTLCRLYVTEIGYSGPENLPTQYFIKVQTSYEHNGETAGEFVLRPAGAGGSTLAGTATNGVDQLAVIFNGSYLDIKNAKSFNLKWKHGSHFHNSRCVGLVEHVH